MGGTVLPWARVELAPAGPNGEALGQVARELCEIERCGGLERSLRIGKLIFTRLFHGDSNAWRDRRRNKYNSLRRLARLPDCPYSKSALHDAVAIYVASLELPSVQTFGHISASHIACVLALPVEQRRALLERAEHERWSVRELRRRAVRASRLRGEHRGRRPRSWEAAIIDTLQRLARKLREAEYELGRARLLTPHSLVALSDVRADLQATVSALGLIAGAQGELPIASEQI